MRSLMRPFMLLGLLGSLAAPAGASSEDLALLPVQPQFGCLTCHSGAAVTSEYVPAGQSNQLNAFGQDWFAYGRSWSPQLADLNSDADGCSNGYELGDPYGDWQPEDGYLVLDPAEIRNPGEYGDCLLPIGDKSFGVLKGLFGSD